MLRFALLDPFQTLQIFFGDGRLLQILIFLIVLSTSLEKIYNGDVVMKILKICNSQNSNQ